MDRICSNCRFWLEDNGGGIGECQRFPPVLADPLRRHDLEGWSTPLVPDDYVCGEHQPAEAGD